MLTSDFVVSATGILISLLFGYFPVLRVKFAEMTPEKKSGIMIGLMVLSGFAVWGAGCIGWLESGLACTKDSIPTLLRLVVIAIVSNQAVNRIAPEKQDVKQAKGARSVSTETASQSGRVFES